MADLQINLRGFVANSVLAGIGAPANSGMQCIVRLKRAGAELSGRRLARLC